ncbi:hypothetical protein GCM10010297_49750 [Streptomyces malachitofuscus]|nr:hypothetical protein GCM10010297_49750 [Streptomyces malachitofuscus]
MCNCPERPVAHLSSTRDRVERSAWPLQLYGTAPAFGEYLVAFALLARVVGSTDVSSLRFVSLRFAGDQGREIGEPFPGFLVFVRDDVRPEWAGSRSVFDVTVREFAEVRAI